MDTFVSHMRQIATLAVPVGFSRAGAYLLILIDTIMVGRADTDQLAYMAIANAMMLILLMTGTGMQIGTAVLASQAIGAKDRGVLGEIWVASMIFGLALGLIAIFISFFGESIFLSIGQNPEISAGAAPNLFMAAIGVPGGLVFVGCTMMLEALKRPMLGMVAMLAANVLNVFLNWLWIYSDMAWQDAGAAAMAATSIARWLAAALLVIYIFTRRSFLDMALPTAWSGIQIAIGKLRRLGYAYGAAQGMESIAFASLTFFAGFLGTKETATFAIVMNVIAACYMGAVGVITATAVQVGRAVGADSKKDMQRAGWAGVMVVTLYMGSCAALIPIVAAPLADLYTNDAATYAIVVPALALSAIIYVPDGMQGVMMGALRGAGDVWLPTMLHLFSFLAIMVPATYYFAVFKGIGISGLIYGTTVGVTAATVFLGIRLYLFGQKTLKRL